ncbi:MAG: YicC/YloC family endoribonuclease [Verrucomicrobiota bacterium]
MKSMTGFGEAKGKQGSVRIEISISSVNSKRGLDLNLGLPRDLQNCEETARELLQQQVTRGRLNVQTSLETRDPATVGLLEADPVAIKHYQKQFTTLQKQGLLDYEVTPEFILKLPGAMKDPDQGKQNDHSALFTKVLQQAITRYQAARKREGQALKTDLLSRIDSIGRCVKIVHKRRPQVVKQHRENLLQRLKQAGFPDLVEDDRILKEVALFADRSDVSEEVTRLQAHLKEGRRLSSLKEPAGKNLDFLVQEIGREINTIGSKSNDLKISRTVLEMKAELEKIREQVQNIE